MELGLSLGFGRRDEEDEEEAEEEEEEDEEEVVEEEKRSCNDLPVQLSLLPFSPVPRQHLSAAAAPPPQLMGFPWLTENNTATRGVDVNLIPTSLSSPAEGALSGSPNSTVSSFHVECAAAGVMAGGEGEAERALSRASDEEEGNARKKLRLSKEQSAYLEESFKEHNTLNPKQKVALAKQLNLRPRQVEVWFQNRRARTKLKQTEVDCEYLKRCCETLTEENRRLQKELSELRALKTPSHPFYMQLPATTLSMCPSCERTTTTSAAAPANPTTALATATTNTGQQQSNKSNTNTTSFGSLFAAKNRFYPFAPHPTTSPAS